MTERERIFSGLHEIFAEIFMRDDIVLSDASTAADIPGWDSFKYVEILMAVEDHFAMKFSSAEIDNVGTLGDLVDIICRKGKSPP